MAAGSKTGLFGRSIPGGVLAIEDQGLSTGDRFFVHSGTGKTTNSGSSPGGALTTIDAAIGKCNASVGDIIYVMPGHAETISAAAGIDADVIGISIIGLGQGANRPVITCDTADTVDIDIDAASVTIKNLIFSANFADIVALIDVNATDFTLDGCHFQATAVDKNFKIVVQDAAAAASDRITIKNCTSTMLDAADTHFLNLAGTGDGHIIIDNILHGNWGTMCLGGAGIVTNCSILRNYIFNIATDADSCINMGATATGVMAGNMCSGGHATDGIVVGDLGGLENYYVLSTAAFNGILEPAVS